jgi:hypothetical protein
MSATTFDTDFGAIQSLQDAHAAPSTTKGPGLFARILDAIGNAYTVKMPDGEIVYIYPPC